MIKVSALLEFLLDFGGEVLYSMYERAKELVAREYEELSYAKERGWPHSPKAYNNRLKQARLLKELLNTENLKDLME